MRLDMREPQGCANSCNALFITRNEERSAIRVRSLAHLFSWNLQGNAEQKDCSPKSRKKLQERYSGLGQLTLSMEYDAVVMQPRMCTGRWDRFPPLSHM